MNARIKTYLSLGLLLTIIIVVFGAMTYRQINVGDYPDHIEITKQLSQKAFATRLAHTLFAKAVIFTRLILPFNWVVKINENFGLAAAHNSFEIATVVLITAAYALTGYVIWKRSFNELTQRGISKSGIISVIITIVVMLVGPISIITYPHQQYIGYFTGNPYHNPTYILMRPFALIWFFIIVDKVFTKTDFKFLIYAALIVYLTTSAKPNFTLSILPAMLLVYVLFYLNQTRKINWWLVLASIGLVSVIILTSQLLLTYAKDSGDAIIFAPFKTLRIYARNNFIAIQKFVMSVAFPLSVTIIYFKEATKRFDFRLGWMNYFVGLITASLFAESIRTDHANFFWGPIAGGFVLFVITTIYYASNLIHHFKEKRWKWIELLPAMFLIAHLVYGIIYYITVFLHRRGI